MPASAAGGKTAMGCQTADYLISLGRRAAGAPPFVGILELDDTARNKAIARTRAFLGGDPARLGDLFRRFPNVAVWLVTHSIGQTYGATDHAIYRHISHILDVPLDRQADRKALHRAFEAACRRFGLPALGEGAEMIDLYLAHAGVSQGQLSHLIEAFLRQEAAFGAPPVESSGLLNRWEDSALDYLPHGVTVPARAVRWDETAWHAALFARIKSAPDAFTPSTMFEQRFRDVLAESLAAPRAGRTPAGAVTPATPPRLIWDGRGLMLRLPRSEGSFRVRFDDAPHTLRLRGGEDRMLPQPWPRRIEWENAGRTGRIDFLAEGGWAAFESGTGQLLRVSPAGVSDAELDARDIVLVARTSFTLDGESAVETEAATFVAFVTLGARPRDMVLGGGVTRLKARARRRLSATGGEIGHGPRGPLLGRLATLRVETGLGMAETRALRLSMGERQALIDVTTDADGFCEVGMPAVLGAFPEFEAADPMRLSVDLMAPGGERGTPHPSGVSMAVWVWPGFRGARGTVLDSVGPVASLVEGECLHAGRDDRGRLCLDPGGGFISARAVFAIGGAHVAFDLPWPDVVVSRRRAEGPPTPLPLGTRLTVGEEDRFDTITIRSPDPAAQLIVRGRREQHPFHGGLTRSLAVRDLLTRGSDDRVLLRRANGAEVLLFELVPSLAPQSAELRAGSRGMRLLVSFAEDVDGLAVEVEDEAGGVTLAEAALGDRPVASLRPHWFHAEVHPSDPRRIELHLDADWVTDGPRLCRILVRPAGRDVWRPLRSPRGDSFALSLAAPVGEASPPAAELARRFTTLSRWLADCFARACWPAIETVLLPRWIDLGRRLRATQGGEGVLMRVAAMAPPDHAAPGWVPILHPLQFAPDLYSAPAPAFAMLAALDDVGVAEMAALAALDAARLRSQAQVHAAVFPGFANYRQAEATGARLEGFSPAPFYQFLTAFDTDPSAGWFWRGVTVLGPDHWRAAHLRMAERFDAAGLFVDDTANDGPNSRRQAELQRLMHAAWKMLDAPLRPPVPYRDPQAEEPAAVDLWASALLSWFARASRLGEVGPQLSSLSARAGMTEAQALSAIAFLVRLAPELFAFHLLLWQIARERP